MDPRDESEIVSVAIAARCNRSGPRFPFHDSFVEKRPTKIFSHDRPARARCQSPRRRIVSCPDVQRRFVRLCASGPKAHCCRQEGHNGACMRRVSGELWRAHSLWRFTPRWLKVSSHDQTASIGVASVSRKREYKCGTRREAICIWTRWGVSDPLRLGCGVRFAPREGGAHAPVLTSIIRCGVCGGIERRRHLDDWAPACSCGETACECAFQELPTQYATRESPRRQREGAD